MFIKNWKTHAKFIGAIIVSVLLVFYANNHFNPPQQAAATNASSPYVILIQEASYGLNCTKQFTQLLKELTAQSSGATGAEYETLKKEMDAMQPLPSRNNALNLVQQQCEGRSGCTIALGTQGINLADNENCSQELDVTYLCGKFDSFRTAKTSHYTDPITIDCESVHQSE